MNRLDAGDAELGQRAQPRGGFRHRPLPPTHTLRPCPSPNPGPLFCLTQGLHEDSPTRRCSWCCPSSSPTDNPLHPPTQPTCHPTPPHPPHPPHLAGLPRGLPRDPLHAAALTPAAPGHAGLRRWHGRVQPGRWAGWGGVGRMGSGWVGRRWGWGWGWEGRAQARPSWTHPAAPLPWRGVLVLAPTPAATAQWC